MIKTTQLLAVCLVLSISIDGFASASPKYGPEGKPIAVPLSHSHEYFSEPGHSSPQFWYLISFYVPQLAGGTCSIATAIMALNSALGRLSRTADDKVITESALINEIKNKKWIEQVQSEMHQSQYVASLDQYRLLLEYVFHGHGFAQATVKAFHVNDEKSATKNEVLKILKEFNENPDRLILANFNQKKFTNDTEVGHYAPVGAFDEKRSRVLILDPDREYYEPYWVSVDAFIAGMNTKDSYSKLNRGLISISVN